jgi:hypothetical protein
MNVRRSGGGKRQATKREFIFQGEHMGLVTRSPAADAPPAAPSSRRFRGVVKAGALLAALWFVNTSLAGVGEGAHHDPLPGFSDALPALVMATFLCVLTFAGLRRLMTRTYARLHTARAHGAAERPVVRG